MNSDGASNLAGGLLFLALGMAGAYFAIRAIRGKANLLVDLTMEEFVKRGLPEQREKWAKIVSIACPLGLAFMGLIVGPLLIIKAMRG